MRLSWQARILTHGLRLIEKPQLARSQDPEKLRATFERKARILFHAPRGTVKRETTIGGQSAIEVSARNITTKRTILYFHGGGYFFGSPRTHSSMMAALSAMTGARVILASYPLAPEHTFPAAPDAAYAVWTALVEQGIDAGDIILGGDSAGGGLALSLLQRLLKDGQPVPQGTFAFAPLTDLTFSGASVQTNAASEAVLPVERASEMAAGYLGTAEATNPAASPLFADFSGSTPIWLCADMTEILLDDTRRLETELKSQGVKTTMTLTSGLPHVWPIFHNVLPEGRETLADLAHWIKNQEQPSNES